MTAKLAAITRDALSLTVEEKIALVQELVADAVALSSPAHTEAWDAEVQRRRQEVESGKVRLVPAEEVERSLDRLLGR
jgi:putative addiction module component (TIGR02574 family)